MGQKGFEPSLGCESTTIFASEASRIGRSGARLGPAASASLRLRSVDQEGEPGYQRQLQFRVGSERALRPKPWHDRSEHVIPKFREPAVSASAR